MAQVKQSGSSAYRPVFFDDATILDGHHPAAKFNRACAQLLVGSIKGGAAYFFSFGFAQCFAFLVLGHKPGAKAIFCRKYQVELAELVYILTALGGRVKRAKFLLHAKLVAFRVLHHRPGAFGFLEGFDYFCP